MYKLVGKLLCALVLLSKLVYGLDQEITPFKYTDELPVYEIPESSRFTLQRPSFEDPNLIYYLSRPTAATFPIAILCEGSSDRSNVSSVIHFHRYFLKECLDLGAAVLTVEQWGIDGSKIDIDEWTKHYTRSQRLKDHKVVIEHLLNNPPEGWNGKLIFIGVSEGGPIVSSLTLDYQSNILATINWSGAGDWPWREELWVFLQNLVEQNPTCPHGVKLSECQDCYEMVAVRGNYDALMDGILGDPDYTKYFLNMTYLYHADALRYPNFDYQKLKSPYLVVSGGLDTIIDSSDLFVEKAKNEGSPVTYFRIADMDHYVRKRPDILQASFEWLKDEIAGSDYYE